MNVRACDWCSVYKREAHWSEQTKAQNTEKGMYVGLKQPRGDEEHCVTPARAAAKETNDH